MKLLETYGVARSKLANHIGVYEARIDRVCRGLLPVTGDLALKLGHAFSTGAETWVYEQAMYATEQARRRMGGKFDFEPLVKPLAEFLVYKAKAIDRCVCGHWGWEHVDYPEGACIAIREDGRLCGCPIYLRLGGYLATKASLGITDELRPEDLEKDEDGEADDEASPEAQRTEDG